MNAKLTLNLDKEVLANARMFAKRNGTTLAELVENHLKDLIEQDAEYQKNLSPLVRELSGALKHKP